MNRRILLLVSYQAFNRHPDLSLCSAVECMVCANTAALYEAACLPVTCMVTIICSLGHMGMSVLSPVYGHSYSHLYTKNTAANQYITTCMAFTLAAQPVTVHPV